MNTNIHSTTDMSNRSSNSLPSGQVACINCNAFFDPDVSPHCPSCGLHYQEMICMNCGESFTIPADKKYHRDIECPHCYQKSYRPFFSGVTDYSLLTEYLEIQDITIETMYQVTDFPFEENDLYVYPRLIQYNPSVPLGSEKAIPSPAREYAFNLDTILSLDYDKRLRIRGVGLLCNTTNTPAGTQLHVRLRDRQNCLQVEDVITPSKGKEEFCLFSFDSAYKQFSKDICLSLWWEKEGTPLSKEVILLSTALSEAVKWEDRDGQLFSPALILYSHVFDKVTQENSYCFSAYPTAYSTSDYPSTDYETTEYPAPDLTIPDYIPFTLMDEDRNLTYQLPGSGDMTVCYENYADFTFFPDTPREGVTVNVNYIELAVPPQQFRNPAAIGVKVFLDQSSEPVYLNASLGKDCLLMIDFDKAGISSEKSTAPVYSIKIQLSSGDKFYFFAHSHSTGPIGGVFGHFNFPVETAFTEMSLSPDSMIPHLNSHATVRNNLIAQITAYPTDAPTPYPTDYPTDFPTSYVTDYPTSANDTNSPATADMLNRPTCFCFKDDYTCDDEDLKKGENGNDDDDDDENNGGGGGGTSGGGTGGMGNGTGNKGNIINDGAASQPGFSTGYGKLPSDSHIMQQGNTLIVNYQKVYYLMSSPGSLGCSNVTERRVAGINSPTGLVNDAKEVCIVNEKGYPVYMKFGQDSNKAYPVDRTRTQPGQLEKITINQPDGSGLPAQSSWLQETLADGTVLRYSMTTGEATALKSPNGVWSTRQDWEKDLRVIYENPDDPAAEAPVPSITDGIEYTLLKRPGSIRQIWSKRDGLLDITTQSPEQYTITWYAPADTGAYNEQTRRYGVSSGAEPVKKWIIQSEFVDYTTTPDGKKYEVGTNRLLSESDLELLHSYTITEIRGEERFVTRWEQPDSQTLIYTRGEGDSAETVITTRTATDPDTLENLRAEYQAIDMAYLRVGDTYTREIEETRTVPGVPGGIRIRYRRFPFGDVCTFREKGTGTSIARSVTYEYDTEPESPSYGCCIKKTFTSGKVVEMAYDAKKRLIMKKTPWAGGSSKITRYTYCSQTEHLHRQVSVTDALIVPAEQSLTGWSWEKALSRRQYAYSETPALKEEKITCTTFSWQNLQRSIPADPQISVTQWYGTDPRTNGTDTNRAAGRLKMRRDPSGMETHYRYHDTTKNGAAYSCTITRTVNGRGIPGQTTQTVLYYDDNDQEVSREEYIHTGQALTLIDGETYTRDDMHRIIRTDKLNGSHTTTLWMCGGPVQETDENGVSTYYQYNSAKRLVGMTRESTPFSSSDGETGINHPQLPCQVIEYFHDAAGRQVKERTTIGPCVTSSLTEWDALNRVVAETDPGGLVTRYTYSADGLTTTATLPTGATLITLSHMDGSILMESGSGRQALFYEYCLRSEGIMTTVRLQSQDKPLVREFFVDGAGHTVIAREAKGDAIVSIHTIYDKNGHIVEERPAHRPGIRKEYDDFGQMKKQIRVQVPPRQNQVTETSQDYILKSMPAGFLTTTSPEWADMPLVWEKRTQHMYLGTDTADVRTTHRWTLVSKTLPHVQQAVLTQNESGMMEAEWTENRQGNIFRYNARQSASGVSWNHSLDGRIFRQKDLNGDSRTWSCQYLADGWIQSVTDTRDNTQTIRYDQAGRVLRQTDAAGNATTYEYQTATGQLIRVTNPDGKTTSYDRDQNGRVVAVYGTAVQPVRFEYDAAGRITALHTWRAPGFTLSTSPLLRTDGDITRWIYNTASGALKDKQMADGKWLRYSYDQRGRIETMTHARGVSVRYTYDPVSELPLTIEYSDGTPGTSYERNDWGQITSVTDASGTRHLTYDKQHRLSAETLDGACTSTLGYGFNEWGIPCGYDLTLDGVMRQELNGEYGGDLHPDKLRMLDGGQYDYNWKNNSPLLEKLTMPNGLTREYSYDPQRNFLTQIRYNNRTDTPLYTHEYSYDRLGRLTTRDSGAASARHHEYDYNDRSEVTDHALTGGDQWTYSYDNIGNRLQSFQNTNGRNYTANALNQYTKIAPTGHLNTDTILPAYDPDGNQTQVNTASGSWTVTWNAENRPIAFVQRDKRIECIYDHMGRRVQKTTLLKGVPTSCRRYAYKGYQLVAELDALEKNDHPELVKSWTWDPTRGESATPLEISFWLDESEDPQYPETEYPTTEYPTTEYPDTVFPEGHCFTSADLYWNEPREGLAVHYLKNGEVTLDMQGFIPAGTAACLDRVELAVKGEYPDWGQYNDKYKVEISLDRQSSMTVYAEQDGNTLKIDLTGYYGKDQRTLTTLGNIQMSIMASPRGSEWENWSPLPVLPCYHDSTGKPLAHVAGVYMASQNTSEFATTEYPTTEYPTTEYPTTEYPTTEYPTTDYVTPGFPEDHPVNTATNSPPERNRLISPLQENINTRAALSARDTLDELSSREQTPGLRTGGSFPFNLNTFSTMNNNTFPPQTTLLNAPEQNASPVTRYDEEFFDTYYPEDEVEFPTPWPTFYPGYQDTVWIRRPSHESTVSETGDTIRFNLSKELSADKELVIDSLELLIYSTATDPDLTIELYLDNKPVMSVPYYCIAITNLDLKAHNISEKDRTLSYRKNIMVKFTKNGRPYARMGICCASPGHPAGHIRGRLKDRNRLLPKSTCQYLTDHNKNVTGLADAQGNIVATWDYDAFGNIIYQTGSTANRNPLRFSSEYHDEDLGLIYYNYRHYNPREGRWISRDRIAENGGINLYCFVKNSPTDIHDLLGQSLEKWDISPDQVPLEFYYNYFDNAAGKTILNLGKTFKIKKERDKTKKGKIKPSIIINTRELKIMINLKYGIDPNAGSHFHTFKGVFQTTETHERDHAKIYIDEWNNNYESVNSHEVSVCEKCFDLQKSILTDAYRRFILNLHLKNYEYDTRYSMQYMSNIINDITMQIINYTNSIAVNEIMKQTLKCD